MPKFSKGDLIQVKKSTAKLGTVVHINRGEYTVHWEHGGKVNYVYSLVDDACELVSSLGKNNPNVVFKKRRKHNATRY